MKAKPLSKRWLILVAGLAILFLGTGGIIALLSGEAGVEEPTPAVAHIQLNPSTGQPGTTVTVSGNGWQAGETVLVYLVEVESNATDGAIYATALANRDGQVAAEFDYPQTLPWAAEPSAIVEARGLSSRRAAQSLFQVNPSPAQPTGGPPTEGPPTSEPGATPTSPSTPAATPVPPTPTATPVPPTPTATPLPPTPTATPVPPTPTPAPPVITDWCGEYYDDLYLAGRPRLVRNDKNIDFQWGTGSPAAGLPADNFGVRWTRRLHFPAGSYRFTVDVDDGARLWVDGQLLIDQWHDGTGSYSGELYLTDGTHDLRLEMYEHTGGAQARMAWSLVTDYPDWKGEYYTSRDLAGSPRLVRNDREIAFDWGAGSPSTLLPADNFGVRWTRRLHFPAGSYRFTVEVDDGARLWVDSQLLIDQWHDGIGSYSGELYLTDGTHDLRLEMYEHTGGAAIQFSWERVADGLVPLDAIRPVEADLWAKRPAFVALDSAAEYRRFIRQYARRFLGDRTSVLPQIPWDREIVLAAFLGEKPAEGYSLELGSITYEGTQVTVHLRIDQAGPGTTAGTADQVVTSPYVMVAVQRRALPTGNLTLTFVDQDGRRLGQARADNRLAGESDR